MRMKTTRVWPIPLVHSRVLELDTPFTVSCYTPSLAPAPPKGFTLLRLSSVHLSIVGLTNITDLNLVILAGIGDRRTITRVDEIITSPNIPKLELTQPTMVEHEIWNKVFGGDAGFMSHYQTRQGLDVPINSSNCVVGVCRPRRPLRFHWQKAARPEMQLYNSDACPCIWAIPEYPDPAGFPRVDLVGFVTFECEK